MRIKMIFCFQLSPKRFYAIAEPTDFLPQPRMSHHEVVRHLRERRAIYEASRAYRFIDEWDEVIEDMLPVFV